jgi:hypothetical protein
MKICDLWRWNHTIWVYINPKIWKIQVLWLSQIIRSISQKKRTETTPARLFCPMGRGENIKTLRPVPTRRLHHKYWRGKLPLDLDLTAKVRQRCLKLYRLLQKACNQLATSRSDQIRDGTHGRRRRRTNSPRGARRRGRWRRDSAQCTCSPCMWLRSVGPRRGQRVAGRAVLDGRRRRMVRKLLDGR